MTQIERIFADFFNIQRRRHLRKSASSVFFSTNITI